ncbi:hypothetical protein VTJ04DRAFT_9403 [Mycothermus thermophilus]|uniref:uncharacterized protein n=1 Tax=Humicola insolens TaxID=85995 RepID=UPI0037433AE4
MSLVSIGPYYIVCPRSFFRRAGEIYLVDVPTLRLLFVALFRLNRYTATFPADAPTPLRKHPNLSFCLLRRRTRIHSL